ncbi:MAG TPA: phosphatase PAP2 family protein [Anaerolineaceae bacterium]|jgi:undecaprenyl-diphosphatase
MFSEILYSPILQIILVILLMISYGLIAVAVLRNRSIATWDVPFGAWVVSRATPRRDRIFTLITDMGKYKVIRFGTMLVCAWLIVIGDWRRMLMLLGLIGVTMLANSVLKQFFSRTRPELPQNFLYGVDFSFPSGHTMLATAFYVMIAYLGWIYGGNSILGWVVVALALILTLLIGFSRIYLGVHFMTDVLGGWMAGGLLFLVILLVGNLLLFNRGIV